MAKNLQGPSLPPSEQGFNNSLSRALFLHSFLHPSAFLSPHPPIYCLDLVYLSQAPSSSAQRCQHSPVRGDGGAARTGLGVPVHAKPINLAWPVNLTYTTRQSQRRRICIEKPASPLKNAAPLTSILPAQFSRRGGPRRLTAAAGGARTSPAPGPNPPPSLVVPPFNIWLYVAISCF